MFMGTYEHGLDAKGRVIVPAKLREALGESFVITEGMDGCLFAYPYDAWEEFADKLKKLPGTKEGRSLQRKFMANAAKLDIDKQGRVLVPAPLRDKAGIIKDVVFAGVISKIEVWSKERWDEVNADEEAVDENEVADHMAEYGLSF